MKGHELGTQEKTMEKKATGRAEILMNELSLVSVLLGKASVRL